MEATLREKLYLTISKFSIRSLFYDYFMFFDTTPYLAHQLFIRHEVRVWFDSEYAKEGSPYLAIFCHVRKKDVPKFLAALEDLKKSMMLCGHPNYEAEISRFMQIDIHREQKTVCIWLSRKESSEYKNEKSPILTPLFEGYRKRAYHIAVFMSGSGDLYDSMLGLLLYNRRKMAEKELGVQWPRSRG